MVIATALFAALIDGCFPARATRLAAAWFALGHRSRCSRAACRSTSAWRSASARCCSRGAAPARSRWRTSVLTALASPVAGAFLALAFLAWALAGPRAAWPLALTVAALAPIALLTLAFPEGGSAAVRRLRVLPRARRRAGDRRADQPREQRVLRIGARCTRSRSSAPTSCRAPSAATSTASARSTAGPVAALRARRRLALAPRALLVLAPFLLYWQVNAPVTDFASTLVEPVGRRLLLRAAARRAARARRRLRAPRPARIEVVPTADHWEARFSRRT